MTVCMVEVRTSLLLSNPRHDTTSHGLHARQSRGILGDIRPMGEGVPTSWETEQSLGSCLVGPQEATLPLGSLFEDPKPTLNERTSWVQDGAAHGATVPGARAELELVESNQSSTRKRKKVCAIGKKECQPLSIGLDACEAVRKVSTKGTHATTSSVRFVLLQIAHGIGSVPRATRREGGKREHRAEYYMYSKFPTFYPLN